MEMDYKRLSKKEVIAHATANAKGDRSRFHDPEWQFMRVVWNYGDAFCAGDVTIAKEPKGPSDSMLCYSSRISEEVLVHDDALRRSSKADGPG